MTSSSPNRIMASPTTIRLNSEHQLLNQMQHHQSLPHHHHHARLPPDLLSYGQHQSLALKNSLNNSSSSGSSGCSSGGSTVIIDHRTQTYSSNNKYEVYAATYDDDVINTMKNIGNDNVDGDSSDSGRLFLSEKHLIRRPSDEPDLRIYHHDIVGSSGSSNSMKTTATQKPFGLLGSSCSTTMTIASGKTATLLPSHRFKNYELSSMPSAMAITSKNNNNYPFTNNSTMAGSTLVMTSSSHALTSMQSNLKSTESFSNASAAHCKQPRQSIVRTSPSFSFLSAGYHQQQDNFL